MLNKYKVFKSVFLSLAILASSTPLCADELDAGRVEANRRFTECIEECRALAGDEADRLVRRALEERAKAIALWQASVQPPKNTAATMRSESFTYSDVERDAIVKFLKQAKTPWGMPLSYRPPKGYWKSIGSEPDRLDSIIERLLTGEEGFGDAGALNLYDGATWQIAMALTGHFDEADKQTQRLLSGRSGDLFDIRAWDEPFLYGENKKKLPRENAFFFRMLTDSYSQRDPLDAKAEFDGFPTLKTLHHEDWKPITGENSWAAIIGPLQTGALKYGPRIPWEADELKLALSILPAVEAMQSSIGAIYHVPSGVHGKHPRDISNENNASMLAALRMLGAALEPHRGKPQADRALASVANLQAGIESYFRRYAYDADLGAFRQGGYWIGGEFIPTRDFAVDVQTWGITILGAGWVNREIGGGDESTAYSIWKRTKAQAGYYEGGELRGVGFTSGHDVLSSEWTFGAILMVKETARYYETLHNTDPDPRYLEWAKELRADAESMRRGIESLKVKFPDGSAAYKYSNRRYYVVFGWWANPVPTLTSSWAVMMDGPLGAAYFNPFVFGGSASFLKKS